MDNELNNIEGQETPETPKTYSEEEVQALLQQETDRRVTSALKKAEAKNAAKVREAEKLAKMSADEKFQYELEQREKAIEEKERALALAENKNECSRILSEKGISLDLVDFVVCEDAEQMSANIKKLEKAFKQSVKVEVENRLRSKVPTQNLPMDKNITKQDFNNMSLTEMKMLKETNPELWNELIK